MMLPKLGGGSTKLSGGSPIFARSPGGRSSAAPAPVLGSFHEGGEVTEDGAYLLKKGEKVTPANGKRDSDYRRVFLNRKKKNDGGDKK
jgi:hypothetical protein